MRRGWSKLSCRCSFTRRIEKGEYLVIANLFDEAVGIEEILLGLSRESNDNVSGERDIRARKS